MPPPTTTTLRRRQLSLAAFALFPARAALRAHTSVRVNEWLGTFYAAAAEQHDLAPLLLQFMYIALPLCVLDPLLQYLTSHWALRWRMMLCESLLDLRSAVHAAGVRNYAQRVQEDTLKLTMLTATLVTRLVCAVASLIAFSHTLWTIPIDVPWATTPRTGYLYATCVAYCLLTMLGTALAGRALPALDNRNQDVEASFRKLLVGLETAVSPPEPARRKAVVVVPEWERICLLSASDMHTASICAAKQVLLDLFDNYTHLFRANARLDLFARTSQQVAVVVPFLVLTRPTISQLVVAANSFNVVFDSLNTLSDNYSLVAELLAVRQRLKLVFRACRTASSSSTREPANDQQQVYGLDTGSQQ